MLSLQITCQRTGNFLQDESKKCNYKIEHSHGENFGVAGVSWVLRLGLEQPPPQKGGTSPFPSLVENILYGLGN